jgi:hypothetical protein
MNARKGKGGGATIKSVLINWTIASVITGLIGGAAGMWWNAPFYFGFFLTFTTVGLIGLFALAVHVTNEQQGPRR